MGTGKEVTKELSKVYIMSLFKDDNVKKASVSSIKAKKEALGASTLVAAKLALVAKNANAAKNAVGVIYTIPMKQLSISDAVQHSLNSPNGSDA
eukprot:768658-Ditylum_brightwellii.AAC.2